MIRSKGTSQGSSVFPTQPCRWRSEDTMKGSRANHCRVGPELERTVPRDQVLHAAEKQLGQGSFELQFFLVSLVPSEKRLVASQQDAAQSILQSKIPTLGPASTLSVVLEDAKQGGEPARSVRMTLSGSTQARVKGVDPSCRAACPQIKSGS